MSVQDQIATKRATKILLSGASGMIGSTLVRTLEERQTPYRKFVRSTVPDGEKEISWNPAIRNAILQPALLEGFTAAVHLSGANLTGHSWTQSYKHELIASRVETARTLAEALAGLKQKPKVFLCASAVGYYGNRGEEVLTEDSVPGSGFLAELCRSWEKATEAAETAGIRVVHLRLGVVLGPGAGLMGKILPVFRCGLGGRLGSGRQWMSWISLSDVVSAIFFLIEKSDLAGPVNLVAPNPTTNTDFTRIVGHCLRRPALFPIPALLLRSIFGEMAQETMLASTRVMPARLLAAGFSFQHSHVEEGIQAALR
jgi:uncharacterized protein